VFKCDIVQYAHVTPSSHPRRFRLRSKKATTTRIPSPLSLSVSCGIFPSFVGRGDSHNLPRKRRSSMGSMTEIEAAGQARRSLPSAPKPLFVRVGHTKLVALRLRHRYRVPFHPILPRRCSVCG
jgi:hypothetical protein